jgi:hypothetical protein
MLLNFVDMFYGSPKLLRRNLTWILSVVIEKLHSKQSLSLLIRVFRSNMRMLPLECLSVLT